METKNLTISLPKRVWEIIDIDFVGLGDTQGERIQHIVMLLLGSKKFTIYD
ncbi:MAG TPA: hypothetical protein VFR65_05090 [Nitrososphaeraceae archaeon]|nr:hypothetical protein [Nitrososphaeraceae archaeon]